MATVKPKQTPAKKSTRNKNDGAAAGEASDPMDASDAIASLQARVEQLEAKAGFDGFDCFHLVVDAESLDKHLFVKIDHPLANGHPNALLFAQPILDSQPLEGFGYSQSDEHWYMRLSLLKAASPDFGWFVAGHDGFGRPRTWWEFAQSPEDFLKKGGNARVVQSPRPIGACYFVAVFLPKGPIPTWVRAATNLTPREATFSLTARAAVSLGENERMGELSTAAGAKSVGEEVMPRAVAVATPDTPPDEPKPSGVPTKAFGKSRFQPK